MNLKELNSFKLSDAVTFHDKLNPKLWNGTKLRPEVRDQLLKIAEDFLTELGVHDLDVKDITISGSNAAYSYTKYSDLDLHILVDMGNLPVDEVYKELFNAKKTIYNDSHDITIHTIPVELYVQDSREPVVSLGEYSVMNDQWIRIPTKRRSDFDQTATKSKYEKLLSLIEIALKSKKYSKVKHIIDTIKRYRQAGLDKGGEFGPENLAYKMLRSQGYITKLYELRDKLHSEKLSFETMYQNIDENEETNHWYDAGVKDATRGARPNPRTYLPTLKDKQAKHPEEIYFYMNGYKSVKQQVDEAFDQPYSFQWKVGKFGEYNAYTKLPDGSNLSIMFNDDGIDDKAYSIEFWRNNSQEATGDGDSQRVFATVLYAIQEFLTKEQPNFISFIGAKGETGEGKNSRVNLYSKLLQRYATKWGYKLKDVFDSNDSVEFDLVKIKQGVAEAFDTPLPITWEKGMHGDIDALAKLPDGTNLSIMFNKQDNIKPDDKTWMVEFYRNNSQEVTGEGDAQKVFSTVLTAIQQFIKKYKPLKIYFSASKEVDMDADNVEKFNPESRAKLYDRMVLRYAKSWGYKFFRADNGDLVMYQLSRIPKQKAVGENQTMQFASEKTPPVSPYAGVKDNQYRGGISEAADKKISFKVQKGKGKFSTTLTVNNSPAGIYQYDSNTGRSIAEVYPEFKGKGLGKLLVLHAIYTAAQLGLDFQEDESRTAAYDNVLDSLSSNGYIVDDDGYWYVTGEGEQYLKQSLNEASGYIPSEKQKNDPRYSTALTVDIKPNSIKKNAKAFYWNTSRAGIPPTAKANGKIY